MSDTRSFITTRPSAVPCPRCGRLVLTGHADGLAYKVDPLPVTPEAELDARQANRWTYAVIAEALALRTATRIGGDTRRARPPVLAAHHCESPPGVDSADAAHAGVVAQLVRRATRRDDNETPAPITEPESDALFDLGRELDAVVVGHDPHTVDPAPF